MRTSEPDAEGWFYPQVVRDDGSLRILADVPDINDDLPARQAIARRLVAAWNASLGLSLDELEAAKPGALKLATDTLSLIRDDDRVSYDALIALHGADAVQELYGADDLADFIDKRLA